MIEQAFHTYIKAVEIRLEARQRPPTKKRGLEVLPNKSRHLCDLVEQLEEGPEFRALLKETISAFRRKDWHSSRSELSWKGLICNFFCRTGFYNDTFFRGSDTSRDLVKRYEKAFQRRHVQATYLAPMEFVQFPKPELRFPGFEIRKFDRDELDAIAGNEVNRVFYPQAVVDTDILQEYWFVVVKTPEELRRWGILTISREDMGWVSAKYTRFPPAIERVLARLVLCDWIEVRKPQYENPHDVPRFGFNIPFVVRVDDNDLQRPQSMPDSSTLKSYLGEEYKAHRTIFDLNESGTVAFEECVKRAEECLGHLRLETDDTHSFLKVAIDNLIKAFFTEELEQLLWHITALEALLGERGPGLTASLARRSATILGGTENARKEWKNKFNDLYDLRSALVHGRQFKKDVHRKQLFEARVMAMRVTIWFVHYFGEIAVRINEGLWKSKAPTREDFLALLDRSKADRTRLKALLNNLPTGFPSGPDWSP